jgi:dienelactone hydrolase
MKLSPLSLLFNLCIGLFASVCFSLAATGEDNLKDISIKQPEKIAPVERVYPVTDVELQWFDAGRSRAVPVKIYYPTSGTRPFPVVLFSHGLGRSREDCAYLGTNWAGRGYVAVFVEHLGSDEAIWRGTVQPKKHLKEAYENPATMRNRPLDMIFALDQLERMKREGNAFAARLDLERIGAAGCDLGAETVLALAGQMLPGGKIIADHRVRAVIAMSPPVPLGQVSLDVAYDNIHVPCLYMTGDEDDGIVGSTKANQRRIPFDKTFGADQFLVTFRGGDHMIYAGHIRQRDSEKDARFQPMIRDASTLFWDAYLGEKSEALIALRGQGLNVVVGGNARVEKKLAADNNSNSISSVP